MMKTEKRKANVGERILITDATGTNGQYKNGDILSVREIGVFAFFGEVGTVRVKEHSRPIYASEYEVIAPTKPKKSERITALETQVAELQAKVEALESASKYPLTARFERESAEVDGILADIKRKAKPTLDALLATYPAVKPTPNEHRADVIKRAKAFISEVTAQARRDSAGHRLGNSTFHNLSTVPEFHVNAEKRTVVALMKGAHSPRLYEKGIAKCDPDDVFNADIGKAIALARALGVEVPVEFVKTVQPTEVVVGQIVYDNDVENDSIGSGIVTAVKPEGFMNADEGYTLDGGWAYLEFARITDDTDAVYE